MTLAVKLTGTLTAGALLLLATGGAARAEPVLTLLVGQQLDGSRRFGGELARLWKSRNRPTAERLAVRTVPGAEARLRALSRGRGHFAIVSADEALRALPAYPRVRAIGALWPVYLHALTRGNSVQALRLPLTAPVWTAENAGFAYDSLWEWSADLPAVREGLRVFPDGEIPRMLERLDSEVLLFTAPAPLAEIARALEADPRLRLLHYDTALLEEFRVAYPWLQIAVLPLGIYPKMRASLEAPARHLMMVGGAELSEASIRKMLDSVYGSKNALSRYDPLFGQTDPAVNALFAPLVPYHPVSIEALGIAEPHR